MKKIMLFSALLCALSIKLFGQSTTTTSSGTGIGSFAVDAGIPVGSAHTPYSAALGVDLKYAIPAAHDFSITLSAGYTELIGQDFTVSYNDGTSFGSISGRANNIGVIPIKIGAKVGANGNATGFFGEAQFGAAFITQGVGTAFAYSP